jgi:hypothetical protein
VTANSHITRLQELGLLQEMTGYKRNRRFAFGPYLALFPSAVPLAAKPSIQWIDPAKIEVGPGYDNTLTPAQVARVEALYRTFGEFERSPLEKWIQDFQRDRDPEREIAIYEAMALAYTSFCSRHTLTKEAREEVYQLVFLRSGTPDEEVLQRAEIQHLSRSDALEVLRGCPAPPQPIRVVELRRGNSR